MMTLPAAKAALDNMTFAVFRERHDQKPVILVPLGHHLDKGNKRGILGGKSLLANALTRLSLVEHLAGYSCRFVEYLLNSSVRNFSYQNHAEG